MECTIDGSPGNLEGSGPSMRNCLSDELESRLLPHPHTEPEGGFASPKPQQLLQPSCIPQVVKGVATSTLLNYLPIPVASDDMVWIPCPR